MAYDPVIQWGRIVAAGNERDWATVEALIADDYHEILVMGDLASGTPTYQNDKAGFMAKCRWAEKRGWQVHPKSVTGLADALVTTFEDTFGDGSSQLAYAIVRFNDRGQAVQVYATVPVLAAGAT